MPDHSLLLPLYHQSLRAGGGPGAGWGRAGGGPGAGRGRAGAGPGAGSHCNESNKVHRRMKLSPLSNLIKEIQVFYFDIKRSSSNLCHLAAETSLFEGGFDCREQRDDGRDTSPSGLRGDVEGCWCWWATRSPGVPGEHHRERLKACLRGNRRWRVPQGRQHGHAPETGAKHAGTARLAAQLADAPSTTSRVTKIFSTLPHLAWRSARLGSARLGSARLGSARLGTRS